MSVAYEQLALDALEQIGATTALAQLDSIAQQAAAKSWSYTHFLGALLQPEIAARKARVIEPSGGGSREMACAQRSPQGR